MEIEIKQSKGKKGKTVIYSISTQINGNTLSFNTFRFWTPEGDLEDSGYKYFEIPGDSILLERCELDREIHIIFTAANGVQAKGFYEDEDIILPNFDLTGGPLITCHIPKDVNIPISIEIMEVIDA